MITGTSSKKLFIIFAICAGLALQLGAQGLPGRVCTITIINKDNKEIHIVAEIADTDALRTRGLMYRKKLDADRGMLFVYHSEQQFTFWMKNTYLPLSIAYISSSGVINEIYDMKPLDTSIIYPSKLTAQYALEVNQGWFAKHRIGVGSRVNLHGCLGK